MRNKTEEAKKYIAENTASTYKEYTAWTVSNKFSAEEVISNAYYRNLQGKAQAAVVVNKVVHDAKVAQRKQLVKKQSVGVVIEPSKFYNVFLDTLKGIRKANWEFENDCDGRKNFQEAMARLTLETIEPRANFKDDQLLSMEGDLYDKYEKLDTQITTALYKAGFPIVATIVDYNDLGVVTLNIHVKTEESQK